MGIGRKKIEELITPVVEAMGYEVWYVELYGTKQKKLLRIYVDIPLGDERKGVSLDDCAVISNQIGALLDVEDCISGGYVLEVSSPGLDRALHKLEHYKRYIGSAVKITLKEPEDGQSNFIGEIEDVVGDKVKLKVEDRVVNIELSNIYKAKLI